jgi:hypothetical protein
MPMYLSRARISSIFVLVLLVVGIFGYAQSVVPDSPTPESWKQSTHNISEADKTGQKDVVRRERSAAFNDEHPDAPKLDSFEQNKGVIYQSGPPYFVRIPALPVKESDAVIVATVNNVQPYFSGDHTHLYTEFSLTVNEQIKDTTGRASGAQSIPVTIRGGKMRLANGRVIEEKPAVRNFAISVGSRYLLFLRYNSTGQYFTVLKSWELKNGRIVPTAHEDQMDEREGKSPYASMTEGKLIEAAAAAAKADQGSVKNSHY